MHYRRRLFFALLLLLSGLTILSAPPASASHECNTADLCVWGENSYTGCFKKVNYSSQVWPGLNWDNCGASINDGANSLKNRHSVCYVAVYEHTQWTGAAVRFNNPASGGIVEDPYLLNGGGYSWPDGFGYQTQNWQDRISSNWFCA